MLFKIAAVSLGLALVPAGAATKPFLDRFATIDAVASTVPTSGPAAGDQNPYGDIAIAEVLIE